MSLFPIVAPFIVVVVVLGVIAAIGNILIAVRDAVGGSEQAALYPVIVALALAAVITAGAFIVSARNNGRQQE
jgi:hypothetical protein